MNPAKKNQNQNSFETENSQHTLRRSFNGTPTAVQTKRIESRATRVRLSKSRVFIEHRTSTEPRY